MRSPGWQSDQVCISKCTLAPDSTRPNAVMVRLRVPESGSTIGRLDKVCGATGTSNMALSLGCKMGPLTDKEYAVEPVGVDMIKPSERWLYIKAPSNSTRTSIMPPRPARLSTTSFKATPENKVSPARTTPPSSNTRSSVLKLPCITLVRASVALCSGISVINPSRP